MEESNNSKCLLYCRTSVFRYGDWIQHVCMSGAFSLLMIWEKIKVGSCFASENLHLRINMRREREKKKKNSDLSKTPATFSSRLESLNISEKGLICSLLNLSPLRKSMALSIRLLISSGPEWTCKACARWFGSRFIEFLVRAARV